MRGITNKIKNNKRILLVIVLIAIALIIIIAFYKDNPKKQEIKNKKNKISVILEQDDGNVEVSSFPPNDGTYVFHKMMCNNLESSTNVTPTWDNSNWKLNVAISATSKIDGQFNCDVYFKPSFASILKRITPPVSTPAQAVGTSIGTTPQLIEGPNDDYGAKTYYFRGNVQNNYVTFAGLTWRVVRINGDGSIRLILNSYAGSSSGTAWNTNYDTGSGAAGENATAVSYSAYGNSTIKGIVDSWYNSNIGNNTNYSSKVVTSKFCNDRNLPTGAATQYFTPRTRIVTNSSPSMICSKSNYVYNLNVGLMTVDEVAFAGAVGGANMRTTNNTSYYLYNSSLVGYWWLISPCYWSSTGVRAFAVNADAGYLNYGTLNGANRARPIVSISPKVVVTTASSTNPGTSGNPYIVQ